MVKFHQMQEQSYQNLMLFMLYHLQPVQVVLQTYNVYKLKDLNLLRPKSFTWNMLMNKETSWQQTQRFQVMKTK